MEVVEKQAVDRDYNIILPPRSSVIEKIDVTNAQTYFTDAMGVEYLGYIMSRCYALELMAKITAFPSWFWISAPECPPCRPEMEIVIFVPFSSLHSIGMKVS